MYICIYIYIQVYIYIYIYICIYIIIYTYVCISSYHIHIYICTYIHTHTDAHSHTHVYICIHICEREREREKERSCVCVWKNSTLGCLQEARDRHENATIDLHAADSVEALRCTSDRIEDSLDAHGEDDTAVAMEGEVMSQGEEGEQNRILAGGCAGQHTIQASKTLPIAGATSPSGHYMWTHTPRGATSGRSYRRGPRELQKLCQAEGSGRTNVGNHTSTLDTTAAAATETTSLSPTQKAEARLAVTARGSVESSCGAHGTRPHIFERRQSGDTEAAHNHFHQARGAQMRMPCFSEEKAQQLPRIRRTGPPVWRHSMMFALWVIYLRLVDREMRSMAQRGNQAKFSHRMLGIQRSPVAYNFQHLREYNSRRIWASHSRRPPYVADVEGCARIEGVAASIHES